jgi:hypothetical protein
MEDSGIKNLNFIKSLQEQINELNEKIKQEKTEFFEEKRKFL